MARIWINDLRAGMVLEKDIYASAVGGLPLLRRGIAITEPFLDGLRKRGVFAVFIRENPPPRLTRRDPGLFVPRERPLLTKKLRTQAITSLEALFGSISRGEDLYAPTVKILQHIDEVVEQLVAAIGDDRAALVNISDLKAYDEYTFHHSLSVAVLAIAIGQYMGFDKAALNRLGKAAIMHDIGKTAVPLEILNKPAKLTPEEFDIVKTHSAAGYYYLVAQGIGDDPLRQGVLSHHERLDGTGYPHGLSGDEIPLLARIISVADVYDALTSHRPYRNPLGPAEAIEYIMGGVGTAFDYDIVDSFIKKVRLYPVGSYVELSSGKVCVVLDSENHLRPVVRALDTSEIMDLFRDPRCLSLVIRRVVPDEEAHALMRGIAGA